MNETVKNSRIVWCVQERREIGRDFHEKKFFDQFVLVVSDSVIHHHKYHHHR